MSVTISLLVGNNGPRISIGTEVKFTNIEKLAVVSFTASVGTYIADRGVWWLPTLDVGHEATISLEVNNPQGGSVEIIAEIYGAYTDSDLSNNTTSFQIGKTEYP